MSATTISPNEPTTIEKMKGLPWSITGDSFNSVFVQFTYFGSVFILFLDALGLSKSQIGVMLSIFPFAGLIALFIAPTVARFGYKRTFLTFWGLRNVITAFLLLTPWVYATLGETAASLFVGLIVTGFALCRATAETGNYPWVQEYVPNHVRGKFTAIGNLFTTIVGIIAIAIAGYVMEQTTNLSGFMLLLATGVIFGFLSVWAYSHIPGGAPVINAEKTGQRDLREALNDRSFRNYLLGISLMTLATVPMVSFLPLFMAEEVGLPDSQVVLLQSGTLLGGLVSVYLWGWAADRYGSTPVMLSGVLMRVFLPIFWLFMPQNSPWSLYAALAIAFFQGVANMGWAIGSARLLFVRIVPPEKKTDYMALYYAWIGVVGGLSQVIGGWILEASENLSLSLYVIDFDPYSPLFLMGIILPLFSLFLFRGVKTDSTVSMGTFAGFLLRGNPFMAMESLVRYHMAKDEETAVKITERLGQAKSLLTVEELLASLDDPRFNVRFEAIVAIGRTRPDEQLIAALGSVLHRNDPSLSVMAAWALGRIHDERAMEPLREALNSDYRSVRAHSARSLGTLGDTSAIPLLSARLETEQDHGLRVAYASALGQLHAPESTAALSKLLYEEEDTTLRQELALALARLVGDEHHFVHLARQVNTDASTTLSQEITAVAKKLENAPESTHSQLTQCAAVLSQGELDQGITQFTHILAELDTAQFPEPHQAILRECHTRLAQCHTSRLEYIVLALHVLKTTE
ncbi:MAG: MFS transporter [Anaerolineae bacterium]|nr:MFS transporter [Anaerolineae bacterium]